MPALTQDRYDLFSDESGAADHNDLHGESPGF